MNVNERRSFLRRSRCRVGSVGRLRGICSTGLYSKGLNGGENILLTLGQAPQTFQTLSRYRSSPLLLPKTKNNDLGGQTPFSDPFFQVEESKLNE